MSWVTNRTAKPRRCCSSLIWLMSDALGDHVERRGRLVHDHELGREQERHRDHGPLAHAAAELMRIAVEVDRVDADQAQDLGRALADRHGGHPRVRAHRVRELGLDALHRVEGVHCALHHHRVVAPAHVAQRRARRGSPCHARRTSRFPRRARPAATGAGRSRRAASTCRSRTRRRSRETPRPRPRGRPGRPRGRRPCR